MGQVKDSRRHRLPESDDSSEHGGASIGALGDEPVASGRGLQLGNMPAVWLDRLLATALEFPRLGSERAIVQSLVDSISALLPNVAVGAHVAIAGGSVDAPVGWSVFTTEREASRGRVPPIFDETHGRLFPQYAHERVFEVSPARGGIRASTLHVAADDASLENERASVVHLCQRAAEVLGNGVQQARVCADLADAKRELRALESHAIQAEKLASFGQIAAGMVHELNNPLTSIVAYTEYLIRRAGAHGSGVAADDADRLHRIRESAHRMLRFTRDLVSYARPSSEPAVPVVIQTIVDQALAFCEHVIAAAGASVERRYAVGPIRTYGLPEQLTQVFINLITNGCHALPPSGGRLVIEIAPAAREKRGRIAVEDNGHGIEPAHLSQVFTPFFTTKREGQGTGLGLSIVRSILEGHGGSIEVSSSAPGRTRFVIELPVEVATT